MTATLAALLVEEGTLSWDRPVVEVFDGFSDRIHPSLREVTLVHLLTHRAGLEPKLPAERPQVWARLWEAREPVTAERLWFAEQLLTSEPTAQPGTTTLYANSNYIVAGAMMEKATGLSWETLMQERLFAPLGMDSCGFGPPASEGHVDAPWGHRAGEPPEPVAPGPHADNPPAVGPSGRVHCSLRDWGRFIALHLRGAKGDTELLPRRAFERLHRGPGFGAPTEGANYAYGWLATQRDWASGMALNHAGSNTMFYAVAWLAPERGRAYLVVANHGRKVASGAGNAAVASLLDAYPPP
jgi:CubicO group peptidase (beta-lactamase class C family)